MVLKNDTTRAYLLGGGIGFLVAILTTSYVIFDRLDTYRTEIIARMSEIETEFRDAADKADRTAVSKETLTLIPDCVARSEFDDYLIRLESLSRAERERFAVLFSDCGYYYLRLKNYHISELTSRAHEYSLHLSHLEYFYRHLEREEVLRNTMSALVDAENMRAQAMQDQIVLQFDIAERLRSSLSAQDATIAERILTVESALATADQKADLLRAELR